MISQPACRKLIQLLAGQIIIAALSRATAPLYDVTEGLAKNIQTYLLENIFNKFCIGK